MDWLEIAAEAARGVRPILEAGAAGRAGLASQIGRDIKLKEDALCEASIRNALARRCEYPILGEETGWGGNQPTEELHWVIDPLDGSFNFYRGVPLYAVSIALCRGGASSPEVLLGVIYDPVRDELVSGGVDHPTRLNGALVPPLGGGARQILATGYPTRSNPADVTARLGEMARDWTKIRMLGSAALSLAWVALGRLDGYEEQNIMWWDVAAGVALAGASGARRVKVSPREFYAMDVSVAA